MSKDAAVQGLRSVLEPKTRIDTSPSAPSSSKRYLLASNDSADDTPWTSATPPPNSYLHLTFPRPITGATHLALTFQGGFVGTKCMVYVATRSKRQEGEIELGLMMGGRIYPEDRSRRQVFRIPYPASIPTPQAVAARAALPSAMTSQASLGPHIVTEVPANPNGNGAPAAPLINGNGMSATGQSDEEDTPEMTELKIEFEESSDVGGRITVYKVEVLG